MTETIVTPARGVELAVEVLGEPTGPVMLLLGGMGWSRDWWDDDLCARLVAEGLRVVRYDQRDTGASTAWPAGDPGYDGGDLVTDALAVLDALGADRAHVVGLSMGGGVAQLLALGHPERVAALSLLSATAVAEAGEDLPGPTPALLATFEAPAPDWRDPDAAVEAIVDGERPCAGPAAFDEEHVRATARRVVARSRDVAASMTNHGLLASAPVRGGMADLAAIEVTVIHGDADPLFPVEHGRALAGAIPGARYVELAGIGHQLVPPSRRDDRDVLVAALVHARQPSGSTPPGTTSAGS